MAPGKVDKWTKTKCIMADKDLLERDVLKKCFPQAHVLICVFHTLKTFRPEMTCTKMGITSLQRDHALQLTSENGACKVRPRISENWRVLVPLVLWEYQTKGCGKCWSVIPQKVRLKLTAKLNKARIHTSAASLFVCKLWERVLCVSLEAYPSHFSRNKIDLPQFFISFLIDCTHLFIVSSSLNDAEK